MEVGTQTLPRAVGLGSEPPPAKTVTPVASKSVNFKSDERKDGGNRLSPLKATTRKCMGRGNGNVYYGGSGGTRHYSLTQEDIVTQQNCSNIHRRRYSERYMPNSTAFQFRKKFNRGGGGHGKIVLPTKFLLGGNITDPLNLNSLSDDAINRSLNAPTPVTSPVVPPPARSDPPIAVNRPINIADPLNLSAGDGFDGIGGESACPHLTGNFKHNKRRRRFRKKLLKADQKVPIDCEGGNAAAGVPQFNPAMLNPLYIDVDARRADDIGANSRRYSAADRIVSPVVPQMSPRHKRRRTSSECGRQTFGGEAKRIIVESCSGAVAEQQSMSKNISGSSMSSGTASSAGSEPTAGFRSETKNCNMSRPKSKRNTSATEVIIKPPPNFRVKDEKFVYGNYSAYYGYRNVGAPIFEDARLRCLPVGLFTNKDVLDIGCNVGYVTLSVARDYGPHRILGIDIDGRLIGVAKKNIRHYMSTNSAANYCGDINIVTGSQVLGLSTQCAPSSAIDNRTFVLEHNKKESKRRRQGKGSVLIEDVQSKTVMPSRPANVTMDSTSTIARTNVGAILDIEKNSCGDDSQKIDCGMNIDGDHGDIDNGVDKVESNITLTEVSKRQCPISEIMYDSLNSRPITAWLTAERAALVEDGHSKIIIANASSTCNIDSTIDVEKNSCDDDIKKIDGGVNIDDNHRELKNGIDKVESSVTVTKVSKRQFPMSMEMTYGPLNSHPIATRSMSEKVESNVTVVEASKRQFPLSMQIMYGPLNSHPIVARLAAENSKSHSFLSSFPHNVMFQTANYVPEKDEVVERQQPEYDVILALSVTKWMHLNNGDDGMKRAFRRMHSQLRPGGKLVLEAQEWPSYRKKKKLTDSIFRVYQSIRFYPSQFRDYLLSSDVGFVSCESVGVPFNQSKGFQRSIQIFTKR